MAFQNLPCQEETQSAAPLASGVLVLEAIELAEERGRILLAKSLAFVPDAQLDAPLVHLDLQAGLSLFASVLGGIGQVVTQGDSQQFGVAVHFESVGEVDFECHTSRFEQGSALLDGGLYHGFGEVDSLNVRLQFTAFGS